MAHVYDRRMLGDAPLRTYACPHRDGRSGHVTSALFSRRRDEFVVCAATDVLVYRVHDTEAQVLDRISQAATASPVDPARALRCKEAGNGHMHAKRYSQAIRFYSIGVCIRISRRH